MKLDLHCHSQPYSGCGQCSTTEMIRAAMDSGLDGMAFTEHDVLHPRREVEKLRKEYPGILLLRGVELSLPEGHLLVYGPLEEPVTASPWTLERVLQRTTGPEFFRVMAHPFRYEADRDRFVFLAGLPLDAVEVASTNTDEEGSILANELADEAGFLRIAASDAHHTDKVGAFYTELEESVPTEREVLQALRHGAYHLSHEIVLP